MSGMKNTSKKLRSLSIALVFLLFGVVTTTLNNANAADLVPRTIFLGSSFASELTVHNYQFQTATPSNIGSIQFQYCSNSPLFVDPCVAPAGLDVSSAGILSESGITGFTVSGSSTASNLIITRAPAAEGVVTANYSFDNIINPLTPNSVNYVRITTFDNVDGTGSVVDTGAVVFVIRDLFDVNAYVPPYMTFCVGVTVALNCSNASGFLSDFGELSSASPTTATSQFSVATNDPTGYNTFVNGQTMTSGANIIPNLSTQTINQPGTSQFGINLRANTNPSVGSNPEAGSVASGAPTAAYNSVNQFRFVNGDRIASSSISTGFNKYTVSYLVNVSENQRPGVYATTLTYTSIASF